MNLVTTQSPNLLEDTSPVQEAIQVIQARNFLKGDAHPHTYYSVVHANHQQFPMPEIITAIEYKYIRLVGEELVKASQELKTNSKAEKPVEMWRRYNEDLRLIFNRGQETSIIAHGILTDLYLEQSQSEDSLASPEYKDSYTGREIPSDKVLVEEEMLSEELDETIRGIQGMQGEKKQAALALLQAILKLNTTPKEPKLPVSDFHREVNDWATRAAIELGWTPEQRAAFIKAQTAFDQDSDGDIEPENTDHDMPEEQDFQINTTVWQDVGSIVGWFNKNRNAILDASHSQMEAEANFMTWLKKGRIKFMVDALAKAAQEDVTTAAIAAMRMITAYGINDNHLHRFDINDDLCFPNNELKGIPAPGYQTLYHFLGEHYDDLLDFTQTPALGRVDEVAVMRDVAVEGYSFIHDMEMSLPEFHSNPKQTRSYIMAYVTAMQSQATIRQAEATAMRAWRQAMDEKASEAYDAVIEAKGTQSQAMAAFWRKCRREVPRPLTKIESIIGDKSGLILQGGRKVTWQIAKMKLQNKEIELDDDIKARLLKALQANNCGQPIWDFLK
jgi:hypothetical protein